MTKFHRCTPTDKAATSRKHFCSSSYPGISYDGCLTSIRSAVGTIDEFSVKVGLHQGSALRPFLFAVMMDWLTDDIREMSPWNMMLADYNVLCCKSREEVENNLEK